MVTEFRTLADRVSRLEIVNQLQAEYANENRELRLEIARLRSLTEASNASRMHSQATTSLPTFTDQVHPPSMAYVSTRNISDSASPPRPWTRGIRLRPIEKIKPLERL